VYTDLPFLPLGTECVINNRRWNADQESELSVGQLPIALSNYEQDARWRLPAGLKKGHMCHPEWLSTGEPWPNDLPPTVSKAPFWIPECCLFDDLLAGGFEMGGDLFPIDTPPANMVCTAPFLGVVGVHYAWSQWPLTTQWWKWDIVPGLNYTLQLDGLFLGTDMTWFLWQGADCATKTFIFGSGGTVKSVNFTATGAHAFLNLNWQFFGFDYGVLLSLTPYLDPSAGGLELGGSAGDSFRPPDSAEGGFELGGSAGDVFIPPDSAEGGLELGGEVGDSYTGNDPTEGGLEMGGSAGDVFTPPGPGSTCGTALVGTLGTTYNFTLPAGGTHWYVWTVATFSSHSVLPAPPDVNINAQYSFGNSCPPASIWYIGTFQPGTNNSGPFTKMYAMLFNPTGAPINYGIQAI